MSSLDASAPSAEEARLLAPEVQRFLLQPAYVTCVRSCLGELGGAREPELAERLALVHGAELFRLACTESWTADDRPLYWSRLQAVSMLRPLLMARGSAWLPALLAFEAASRGLRVESAAHGPQVLVTGFDPFRLQQGVARSNPSGAAALAFAGREVVTSAGPARVRSAIFPVRFADFDAGCVERYFGSLLARSSAIVAIVTLSQNNAEPFAIERWAGAFRTTQSEDNAGRFGDPAQPETPVPGVMPLAVSGATHDHLETSLPVQRMLSAQIAPDVIRDADERPAHAGSGGSFLSNEIFYRTRALLLARQLSLPMGHLHLPLLAPPSSFANEAEHEARRAQIVEHTWRVLCTGLT